MKNKGYSLMKAMAKGRLCYIKKTLMSLISKKHIPLHISITLLIVIICCSFEFSFAEDGTDTSKSHKDSTDVSELLEESKATEEIIEESKAPVESPADSSDTSESHKDSTDVSELLEESKAIAETIESEILAESPADANDIPELRIESTDVSELLKESKVVSEPEESKVALELPVDANDISELPKDSQDVSELLEESKKKVPRQWFEDEVVMRAMRPYSRAKKYLHDEYRLDTATEQVFVYQRATGGRRPREQSAYNFTFFGQWHISQDKEKDLGIIGFSFEERDNISDHSVGDFSSEVGSSFKTHGLQTDERSRTALREVWWRKKYDDDKVILTLGKLHHSSYYNRNNFAGNARTFFTSRTFSRNPNRLLPADGLGGNLKIKFDNDRYVSVGFGDVRAKNKTSGFDTFGDGDFFSAVELGLTPKIPDKGQGNYRFTLWHIDETELVKEGSGFALSFDQELGEKYGVFARYGYTEPQSTSIEHYLSGGFVVRNPWGIKGDMLGVGVSWDQTSDTKEDEFAVEIFHRIQVTRLIQVTPSILIIFDPVRSDKTEPIAVFGLRTRLLF